MTNPYEAPQSDDVAVTSGVKTRLWPGLLLFAIVWPLIVHLIQTAMLRCLPLLAANFRPAFIRLMYLPVLFGYTVCIYVASRDSDPHLDRVLLGATAMVVMLSSGQIWWMMLRTMFPRFF